MLPKISYANQFFLWAMLNEPQISFDQALEVFQGQIKLKVNRSYGAQNIIRHSIFLWAMLNEPQISLVKL